MASTLSRDWLVTVRQHVLDALDGLDDEALRRPVLPSAWSCLDLLRHLTYDVEVFWFSCVVSGDQARIAELSSLRGTTWTAPPEQTSGEIIDTYRRAITTSDAITAATPLDAPPVWWPGELFGDWRLHNLEEIIMHVIVETSRHAGQLDAVRELLDGKQWLVLTG